MINAQYWINLIEKKYLFETVQLMVVSPENSWRMGRMEICENTATKIIIPQQGKKVLKKMLTVLFLSLTGFWFQILMDQVVVNFFRSKILSMVWKNSFSFFLLIIRSQFWSNSTAVPVQSLLSKTSLLWEQC